MRFYLLLRYTKKSKALLSQARSPIGLYKAFREIFRKFYHLVRYRWCNRRWARKSLNVVNYQVPYKELVNYFPLVTVIVPNFNHGSYLHQRLQSIYGQTYRNFNVVLLDDKSSDNSIEILTTFQKRYPSQTELVTNAENSGSGYRQWLKGISLAKGELIWIAESDDVSDVHFLETMVSKFANPGVTLAFCNTNFFTNEIQKPTWNLHSYWSDKTKLSSENSWVIADKQFAKHGMSENNLIPNVSSCLFRTNSLAKKRVEWATFDFVGDWVFYHITFLGGLVSYESKVLNHYRSHEQGVINQNRNSDEFQIELRSAKKSIHAILDQKRILMALPGMVLGGGEIFAYRLAATLVNHNFTVSILNAGVIPDTHANLFDGPTFVPILDPQSQEEFATVMFSEFDCLHTHHGSVDYLVSLNNFNEIPQVISLHGMYEEMDLRDVARSEVLFDHKNLTFTYLVEKNLSAFTSEFLAKKNFVKVNNFIPDDIIPNFERRARSSRTSIALISRAIEGKGWIEAISAVELSIQHYELDLNLSLYGSGPIYDACLESYQYSWLRISAGTPEPLKTLCDSDLYLFLSTYPGESMPLVILECLATGTPLIFSNIPILHNLLFDEEGPIGFPVDLDENGIVLAQVSERIKDFTEMSNSDLDRLRIRMKKKYSEFDEKFAIESYLKVYRSITQSKPAVL